MDRTIWAKVMSKDDGREKGKRTMGMTGASKEERLVLEIDCSRSISPREASLMLEWASECSDPMRAVELLRVFKALGGLQLFHETNTDGSGDTAEPKREH